jgi:cytochrome b6-f complex iron-sulfur subunit
MPRRSFFSWLTVAWLAFAAATGGFLAMTVRFLFPNVLFEPPQSFKIGYPDDYQIGQVNIRWKKLHAIWVVRTTEHIYALSTVCTHLGCTPNWLDNERKFKCPCHGSGFRKSGVNFEGPAPRPLERFKIALADDGQILVDKSKLFQYEKGQWDDPESFLKV